MALSIAPWTVKLVLASVLTTHKFPIKTDTSDRLEEL